MKKFFILIFVFYLTIDCFSQNKDLQLIILSTDSITKNKIEFRGSLHNNSNESKKFLRLNLDCDDYTIPHFWKVQVYYNRTNYEYVFPIIVAAYGVTYKFHRIRRGKTYELKFCIDFSKLAPVGNKYDLKDFVNTTNKDSLMFYNFHGINNYFNKDYGVYSIKLLYHSYFNEMNVINHLESNSLTIKYYK
jgi:hypothetical protein